MLVLMFDAFKTGNLGQLHPLADMIYCSITLFTEELTNWSEHVACASGAT